MELFDWAKRLVRYVFFIDYFLDKRPHSKPVPSKLDFAEEGRQDIYNWSQNREKRYHGLGKHLHLIQLYGFSVHLLRSFVEHFNFMVILQMILAAMVTFVCKDFDIQYDIHVSLFITPIVFPLAFSINADFRRKEQVLEDLAKFKSAAMTWFFCMRDWREACSIDIEYMTGVRNKIKGLMIHIREYLLTEKTDRRNFIVRVIYEDFSDANQLNEKVRRSTMKANSPLVSRVILFLNTMCHSFERLRVIREYRSPRSIRSFTKVLIFILPLLLSPYYVHLGSELQSQQKLKTPNNWSPYYISVMVAFVFGALQAVHDRLDDPFDGMCEDDINLDTLDEWTMQSLEATCNRSYKIGRFQVVSTAEFNGYKSSQTYQRRVSLQEADPSLRTSGRKTSLQERRRLSLQENRSESFVTRKRSREEIIGDLEQSHPFLNDIQGNTTILRSGHLKRVQKSFGDLSMIDEHSLSQSVYSLDLETEEEGKEEEFIGCAPTVLDVDGTKTRCTESNLMPALKIENNSLNHDNSEPIFGVASYLSSAYKKNNNCPRNYMNAPLLSSLSHDGPERSVNSGSVSNIINYQRSNKLFGDHDDEIKQHSLPRLSSRGTTEYVNRHRNFYETSDNDSREDIPSSVRSFGYLRVKQMEGLKHWSGHRFKDSDSIG